MKLKIIHANSNNNDFQSLGKMMVKKLDNNINPKEVKQFVYSLENIENCFVAYIDDQPVGCGCYKHFKYHIAEIKKIFTLPAFRGKGVCKEIIKNIEKVAAFNGYKTLVLETSQELQSSSTSAKVYEKLGYKIVPNFPPYLDKNISICMSKNL